MAVPSNSLRLRSISICGIGSYLHGAELQIRPFTLLCGKNGSGKSTWFKVIDLLKASCGYDNRLPFRLADKTPLAHSCDLNNLAVRQAREWKGLPAEEVDKYGPPGSITLKVQALEDARCAPNVDDAQECSEDKRDRLFWAGLCSEGSTVTIRLSLEPSSVNSFSSRSVSLSIDNLKIFSFEKNDEDDFFKCFIYPQSGEDALSSAMVRFADAYLSESAAVTVTPHLDYVLPGASVNQLINMSGKLLSGLLSQAMSSFHIGAIREPGYETGNTGSRYVGHRGEYSFDLFSKYGLNRMLQPDPPFSGYLTNDTNNCNEFTLGKPSQSVTTEWRERLRATKTNVLHKVLSLANTEERDVIQSWVQTEDELPDSVIILFEKIALRALESPDLYDSQIWGSLEPEAKDLVEIGPKQLCKRDLRRLNLFLLDDAFSPLTIRNYDCSYIFEIYVGAWLKRLLDIAPGLDPLSREDSYAEIHWQWDAPLPRGYLAYHNPHPEIDDLYKYTKNEERFDHPCLPKTIGGGYDWRMRPAHFSSGFHQVFPIIIQAGLMKKHELLCIENPEVHLHPSLQAALADFLIGEAASGKYIIAETHSDLFVIKTLKAILQGKLNQEQVRIYFTSLAAHEEDILANYSTLEQIRVNKYGRVANWPAGFMDTEVIEMADIDELLAGDDEETE